MSKDNKVRETKANHFKHTNNTMSVTLPIPKAVFIPLQQHIGAPCEPIVEKGDYLTVGQVIARSDKPLSAIIHSSISGTYEGLEPFVMPNGNTVNAMKIVSDGKTVYSEDLKPITISSSEDLVNAAYNCGLVGLGGAGFPTHIKLKPIIDKGFEYLIINIAECEPYITTDYRECIENCNNIVKYLKAFQPYLNSKNIILAVEDNKPKAISVLEKAIKENKIPNTSVMKLKTKYPQGAEKVLIYAVTGRQVPMGKLPGDVGCAVMNISTFSALGRYVFEGIPLISKRITLDGDAINNPGNYVVPLGTKISDVIEYTGGYKSTPTKILMGGPMMGLALKSDDYPIMKQNNAILVFSEIKPENETACIRCGKCIQVCPMKLAPTMVERAAKSNDIERLRKLYVLNCMECGCCAYNCPAKKQLVQIMRDAKKTVREANNG